MRNEDCIAGMQKIRKKSVDLIITDPPFAIEFGARKANYNRKGSRVLQGYGEIAQSEYAKFTHNWMEQAYMTLKERVTSARKNSKLTDSVNDFKQVNHYAHFLLTNIATRKLL